MKKKTDGSAKTISKSPGKKRATTDDEQVVALDAELREAKAVHARLVDVAAHPEVDAYQTRTDLEVLNILSAMVEQEVKLAGPT